MIYINEWFGRLGNNIHQLVNAYILAEKHVCNVGYPNKNRYYNQSLFKPSPPINNVKKSGTFFRRTDEGIGDITITENDVRRVCLNNISKLLDIKDIDIPDDVIIVHIRNGDIFKSNPHGGFVQPPLSYYTAIFEREGISDYSKVWVLCSNEQPYNPVVDELDNLGCVLKIEAMSESINILSNAKVLISSRSSFSKYLFFLSKKANRVYVPDFMIELDIFRVNIPDYIKVGDWNASPQQKSLMLTYSKSNITIEKYG